MSRPALASAHKKLSATYQLSYMKHAPIGPTMAVADVKADGTVHIYTHNQNPQALRGEIAMMLRHDARSCDRAFVSRARPLRQVERRKRRRGRRGGALVASRRQAGARAVDARRRYAVVDASGRRVSPTFRLRSTKKAKWPPIRSTTTCPRCRTIGRSVRCLRACRRCRRRRCNRIP